MQKVFKESLSQQAYRSNAARLAEILGYSTRADSLYGWKAGGLTYIGIVEDGGGMKWWGN
jgi:hypothetical protein